MAISQNTGTTITALLPALFATVAPPGSANIPLTVGTITLAITLVAAAAAWSAARADEGYQTELTALLRDFGGRPTPLYRARPPGSAAVSPKSSGGR